VGVLEQVGAGFADEAVGMGLGVGGHTGNLAIERKHNPGFDPLKIRQEGRGYREFIMSTYGRKFTGLPSNSTNRSL
jgi:hypothetical protein